MFITSTLRKVLHVQLDLAEKVCFTSACYRNGASAYGIFITVVMCKRPGKQGPTGEPIPCVFKVEKEMT